MIHPTLRCTAFAGPRRIASGELRHVALKARQAFDAGKPVRVFEDASGMPVALPLALPAGELLRWLADPLATAVQDAQAAPRGPGHCAHWSTPRAMSRLKATAAAPRRKPATASCRPWPATRPASPVPAARCSPATSAPSRNIARHGLTMCGNMPGCWRLTRSTTDGREDTP